MKFFCALYGVMMPWRSTRVLRLGTDRIDSPLYGGDLIWDVPLRRTWTWTMQGEKDAETCALPRTYVFAFVYHFGYFGVSWCTMFICCKLWSRENLCQGANAFCHLLSPQHLACFCRSVTSFTQKKASASQTKFHQSPSWGDESPMFFWIKIREMLNWCPNMEIPQVLPGNWFEKLWDAMEYPMFKHV